MCDVNAAAAGAGLAAELPGWTGELQFGDCKMKTVSDFARRGLVFDHVQV
jgi:hypothetical protein